MEKEKERERERSRKKEKIRNFFLNTFVISRHETAVILTSFQVKLNCSSSSGKSLKLNLFKYNIVFKYNIIL